MKGESPRFYQVRNNVLMLSKKAPEKVAAALSMERDTLDQIVANMTNWAEALSSGAIEVQESKVIAARLTALIE